jgi:ribonucleoside-diphosphate reductase beta chain
MSDLPQLRTPSVGYKPFRYPWAYDFWSQQQRVHWLPEEIPMGEDVKDWKTKLSDNERELLTQVFRFFTQADIDVNENYMRNYAQVFRPTEVQMMLAAFSNIETVHIAAYSLLVETVGMPDSEYQTFLEYSEMSDKHEFLSQFNMDNDHEILKTMAAFGAFTEGLQLFASFAMLLNFPRFGKMKGMGQVVAWSVRDESLHCEGMIKLFHEYAKETGAYTDKLKEEITDIARRTVELEDRFIDLAFGIGEIQGTNKEEIKLYIRYICDWRLGQLHLPPIYGVDEHPLPWLTEILNGVEHANFFETRSTEYSKAATKGT